MNRLGTAAFYLAVFGCMINFLCLPVASSWDRTSRAWAAEESRGMSSSQALTPHSKAGLSGEASEQLFEQPIEQGKLQPAQVVRFRVLSLTSPPANSAGSAAGLTSLQVLFETRAGFKIYDKGLEFRVRPEIGDEWKLAFASNPAPTSAHDPWYDEVRATHGSGAVFTLTSENPLGAGDRVWIRFEACSVSMCLLPVWFELAPNEGAVSVSAGRAQTLKASPGGKGAAQGASTGASTRVSTVASQGDFPGASASLDVARTPAPTPLPTSDAAIPSGPTLTALPPAASGATVLPPLELSLTERVALFVQQALTGRSPWLFPALLLAGLLMNLTPCVYPMIPITLNVLGRLGRHGGSSPNDMAKETAKEHWTEGVLRAAIYVLGIVLTYSVMGVAAGMTGTLFGSLLQSQAVLVALAVLFGFLGLAMLGIIDLSKVQVWASRIPISEKSPHLGVFTMGAVSGLVSAPCTGPVLSALLILIGKSQDPVYGFALMSFFSLGFGLPYLVLGVFAHNLRRVPRAGRLLELIKVVFAALLFGLALYYLKALLSGWPILERIYAPPGAQGVALCVATAIIFWLLGKQILQRPAGSDPHATKRKAGMARLGLMLSLTQLALWLSLFVTNGFVVPRSVASSGSETSVPTLRWQSDWKIAVATARGSGKGLLVDAWAQWCAACLKMDAELWADPAVIKRVNERFVALKLDFTESSPFTDEIASRWDIVGLPAVGIFPAGGDFEAVPPKLFRSEVTKAELFAAFDALAAQSPAPPSP